MSSQSDPKHERNVTLAKLVGLLFVAGILGAGALLPIVGGLGLVTKKQTDKFLTTACDLQETAPPSKTTFYASDGSTVLATLFTQDRDPVPLSDIPKYLQQALIATEDRRFYSHSGVDMRGLIRSAFSTSSGDTQGGSTLTMQYVKQVRYYQYVSTENDSAAQQAADAKQQQAAISQNLNRKIEDANCALYIENVKHESKDTILDNYLNIAFFGENAYGIQSAAETYFGKNTKDLTLPEAAMLVGVLQAPSDYDPVNYKAAARERRNVVIQNLVEVGDLTQAQADTYKATPIVLSNTNPVPVQSDCTSAIDNGGFFCKYAQDWLTDVSQTVSSHDLYTGGLKVVTTLDANIQANGSKTLSAIFPATSSSIAIMPVIDPKTGNVLAMLSNKLYGSENDGQHNATSLFTTASASGASTYKYFMALAALKTGVPANLILDGEQYATSCGGTSSSLPIKNDSASIPNTTTMANAFAVSSNTYFIALADKLFADCDLQPYVNTAEDLGLNYLKTNGGGDSVITNNTYSFAIGTQATVPLELTSAYAVSANDGTYCPPSPILSVTDANGNAIQVKRGACVQKLAPQVARTMISIMTGDTTGGGTAASAFTKYYAAGGSQIASKTGTQNATLPTTMNSAAWYVGTTPNLTATLAIYDPNNPSSPLHNVPGAADGQASGTTAATIWEQVLSSTLLASHWSWPSASVMPNGTAVPNVVGQTLAAATTKLQAAGFKVQSYGDSYNDANLSCNSSAAPNTVAYQSPSGVAPTGATVTLCQSTGNTIAAAATPKPTVKATPKPGASAAPAATPAPAASPGG